MPAEGANREPAGVGLPVLILAAVLVIAGVVVALVGDRTVSGLDAAGMILLIGAVAVGIERVIEFAWTAIGLGANAFWPLNRVAKYVTAMTDDLDAAIAPVYASAQQGIDLLKKTGRLTEDAANALKAELGKAKGLVDDLKLSAKDSAQLETYATAASNLVNTTQLRYGAIIAAGLRIDPLGAAKALAQEEGERRHRADHREASPAQVTAAGAASVAQFVADHGAAAPNGDAFVDKYLQDHEPLARMAAAGPYAAQVLEGVGEFLGTFKDNPGKRLLSIQLGAIAGVLIAGVIGLDVFAAVLHEPEAPTAPTTSGEGASDETTAVEPITPVEATWLGMLMTGIVMGLGASPTHEVIKLLQQYKERNKKASAPSGGAAEGTDTSQFRGGFAQYEVLGYDAPQRAVRHDPGPYLVRFG